MARVKFQIGDEVAVLDSRGEAWRIVPIMGEWTGGWCTSGSANDTTRWSKTGLSRDSRRTGQRIVPATDEHKRAVRVRDWRYRLDRRALWLDASAETIEAVAKLLGWA